MRIIFVCLHIYIYTYIYIYIYIYIHVYIYIYTCVYVYIYIYTDTCMRLSVQGTMNGHRHQHTSLLPHLDSDASRPLLALQDLFGCGLWVEGLHLRIAGSGPTSCLHEQNLSCSFSAFNAGKAGECCWVGRRRSKMIRRRWLGCIRLQRYRCAAPGFSRFCGQLCLCATAQLSSMSAWGLSTMTDSACYRSSLRNFSRSARQLCRNRLPYRSPSSLFVRSSVRLNELVLK